MMAVNMEEWLNLGIWNVFGCDGFSHWFEVQRLEAWLFLKAVQRRKISSHFLRDYRIIEDGLRSSYTQKNTSVEWGPKYEM
jgi:hypothetical protein